MDIKKLFFFYLFALLVGQPVQAEVMPADTLMVVQIAQEQGLSQLGATSLQFDDMGYLWIGTQNGLNRFNGYQMKVWLADDVTNDFPNDLIRGIHYQNDTLWMTTHTHALCAYLMRENRFLHFCDQLDLEKTPALKHSVALHATSGNTLIVGTAGHCLLFDRKKLTYEVLRIPQLLEHDFVTCIETIDDRFYLVGTNAGGLFILDIKNKSLYTDKRLQELQHMQINALYRQDNGVILLATGQGLYRFYPDSGKLRYEKPYIIRSIHHWNGRSLLMGGRNETFLLTDQHNWQRLVFVDSRGQELRADVLAHSQDEQGGRWLGTESRGVFYYHPYQTKFRSKRIRASNAPKADFISVFNFLRDDNSLWLANEFGFARHTLGSDNYKLFRTDFVGYTLAKDAHGTIWAAGYDQGLFRYNRKADKLDHIPLPFLDRDIVQLTPISPDTLWIHTLADGIHAMHTPTLQCQPVRLFDRVMLGSRGGYVDTKGNIWVGSEHGLYRVTPNRSVTAFDSLSNERVFAITEDSRQHIWIGTAKGLNKLDPATGRIRHYTKQTGLPNDFIYGVLADRKNNIWVSTNYGISVLNPTTGTFKNYTEEDGLQNNEFNGKAAYQDSLGYLYFGGMDGFNIFHPDSIPINRHTGRTYIENIQLFGRSIDRNILYADTLTFSHDQNVITFDFVNLNYLWSKKNRYQFMLEGFDKKWRPVTRDRSTTYTNLSPGTYRFKVRGSNNELLWADTDEMTVIIQSPWYATTLFRAGLALFIIACTAGVFFYKTYQQRKTNKRLQHMVSTRTKELSQTNLALHESLELTQQQKENISFLMQELNHRVKNNLQLITSLIDIQSFEIDDRNVQDKLRTLQSRVFTVSKIHDLLNIGNTDKGGYLGEFIDGLALDLIAFSGKDITFSSNIAKIILPSNKLTYIGLILNELITNSIKHAFPDGQPGKKIAISISQTGSTMTLRYHDNGIGFDAEKIVYREQKGMGLIHMLIHELKSEITMDTRQSTTFTITSPLDQPI